MNRPVPSLELVDRAASGDIWAIGRLISRVEADSPDVREAIAEIYRRAGNAHVVGVTGVPGSGKSTLVAVLADRLSGAGRRVGIVAVDPSSPYSGGAILGDRVRMSELARRENVYIRSMASAGSVGGLARATLDAVDILDMAGYETIIVETVGAGQDEVEIAMAAHSTIVVSAPGLGDEIQAIKAGMLEIADIHVVSKCDRSDANRTLADLKQMMTLGTLVGRPTGWAVPVVGVSSLSGQGIDELVEAIEGHRGFALDGERGLGRRLEIAAFRLRKTSQDLMAELFKSTTAPLETPLAGALERRESDPYSAAAELVAAFLRQGET